MISLASSWREVESIGDREGEVLRLSPISLERSESMEAKEECRSERTS